MRIVDIHSHLLPRIDDGAKDVETSIEMLGIYKNQGVTDVFATPHFMPMEMDLEEFLENRSQSLDFLLSKIDSKEDYPQIHLGAEVFYFTGIGKSEDIKKLKLEGTNYILIEMPFEPVTDYLLNDICEITKTTGLIPIIAHIERISFLKGYKKLLKLFEAGVLLAQVNASSFLKKPFNKIAKKLVKGNFVSFVATDAHSATYRPPVLDEALSFIKNSFDYKIYNRIMENISGLIFSGEENDDK